MTFCIRHQELSDVKHCAQALLLKGEARVDSTAKQGSTGGHSELPLRYLRPLLSFSPEGRKQHGLNRLL